MSFESVARKVKEQKWKSKPDGQGDGERVNLYFQREHINRIRERCKREGIPVSRYLQTLALESLERP